MKKTTLTRIFISIVVTFISIEQSHSDIYRWVDKDSGEIFFAAEPPPPEVTTEYENITADLQKRVLKRSAQVNVVSGNTVSTRLSPDKSAVVDDKSDTEKVMSDAELLAQNRCQIFSLQIDKLELSVSGATDPDEMDNFYIKLAEYERSYAKYCRQ